MLRSIALSGRWDAMASKRDDGTDVADGGAESTDDTDSIELDEIETYLCCPRRYQYDHEQEIRTRTTQDAVDDRTELYRDVITSTLAEHGESGGDEVPNEALYETATKTLQRRLDAPSESDSQGGDSSHQRYDEASVRNAIANYIDDDGTAHAEGAIAIDETYTYETGGYTFACPVDCCWIEDSSYEIARFVTTLDGIVWENPYSDPVAGYRDQEGFYPRQVGSILRAYATIHAVAAAHGIGVHNVSYRYYAIAEETYPSYEDDGRRAGPEVVSASRDVTDACWEAGEACASVLAEAATGIVNGDWSPTGDRWADILSQSCQYCKYESMCLDALNEEVRF